MTQEDKQLLLLELSTRLPYKVICRYSAVIPMLGEVINRGPLQEIRQNENGKYFVVNGAACLYKDIKPYLRPITSMTEEEKEELVKEFWGSHTIKDRYAEVCWYLSKHFDINDLIPKGIALDCTNLNIY